MVHCTASVVFKLHIKMKQEAHGPQFAHLIKTAIAYLQMPCSILPVLPQQLVHKFDHTIKKVKGHPSLIILTNLVDLKSPMLYTKIQPQSFLSTREEDSKVFLPYMNMAAVLFNGAEPFEQIVNIPSTEDPKRNQVKIGQAVSEKMSLKISRFYTCI